MEAHDLAFDRNAYLDQRDEDAQTVSSAAPFTGTKGPTDDYFNARRQDYMNRGPHAAQTPDDLPYEISRMPTTNSMSSTENLIQYPPQYTSPQQDPRYGSRPSFEQPSYDYYGQQGMSQRGMEIAQAARGHAPRPSGSGTVTPPYPQYRPDSRQSGNGRATPPFPHQGGNGRATPPAFAQDPDSRPGTPPYAQRPDSRPATPPYANRPDSRNGSPSYAHSPQTNQRPLHASRPSQQSMDFARRYSPAGQLGRQEERARDPYERMQDGSPEQRRR